MVSTNVLKAFVYLGLIASVGCTPAHFKSTTDKGELLAKSNVLGTSGVIGQGSDGSPNHGSQGNGSDGSGSLPNGSDGSGGSSGGSNPSSGGSSSIPNGADGSGSSGGSQSSTIPKGADGSGTLPNGSDGSGNYPAGADGTGPAVSNGKLPIVRLCSDGRTQDAGSNVTQATQLQLTIKDNFSGQVVCDLTEGVRESIINNRVIDLSSCSLPGNSYSMFLKDPIKKSQSLFYNEENLEADNQVKSVSLSRKNNTKPLRASAGGDQGEVIQVLYAMNDRKLASVCDEMASPLVVDMTPEGEVDSGMRLTRQAMGILFDILGLNSSPKAHMKKQISWIRNPNYMFLALPNAQGRVDGVDELFGNNTQGPDAANKFAKNGFLALAKYDLNHDNIIDAKDPVFKDLRLWSDVNFDGKSQPSELHSLADMKVVEIDLVYDPSYFERDRYGNESRLKSAVKLSDQSLRLVFDLWFALKK